MSSEDIEAPEDLQIQIGTTEQKFWTELKDKTEKANIQCDHEKIINNSIITLCKQHIAKEKRKV